MRDMVTLNLQWLWFLPRQSLLKHREWETPELRMELFQKALTICETTQSLRNAYAGRHWDWLFHGFHQATKWHLASTMLVYLHHHTDQEDSSVQRAWAQINMIYQDKRTHQGVLWKPLLALKREAEVRRDEAIIAQNENMQVTSNGGLWQNQLDPENLASMPGLDPTISQWGSAGVPLSPNLGMPDDFYNSVFGGYSQSN